MEKEIKTSIWDNVYEPTFFVEYDKWILFGIGLVIFIILNLIAHKGGKKLFIKNKIRYLFQLIIALYSASISFLLTVVAYELFDELGFYWSRGLPSTGVVYSCRGFINKYGGMQVVLCK